MSYCVNCGVELDITATACPLCNTKIYNPNQPPATDVPTPYATVKGHTEPVKKKKPTKSSRGNYIYFNKFINNCWRNIIRKRNFSRFNFINIRNCSFSFTYFVSNLALR